MFAAEFESILDSLDNGYFYNDEGEYPDSTPSTNAVNLASTILNVVKTYFTPLPLFDDGEPVVIGEFFESPNGVSTRVDSISYISDREVIINRDFMSETRIDVYNDRIKHVVNDSQDKIDDESYLNPVEYCEKYGLVYENASETKMFHLLERQQKLYGAA